LSNKNDDLLRFNKIEIDEMQNIAEVKEYAKNTLDINRRNSQIASTKAWYYFYLFLCLLLLQFVILGLTIFQNEEKTQH
jgi:hypothetical protein